LSIILGFALSYRIALYNYKPLADVIGIVHNRLVTEGITSSNEYKFLEKSINRIFESNEKIGREVKLYKPLAKNVFLIQLLRNEINRTLDTSLLGMLGIAFNYGYFTCIAVLMDKNDIPAASMQNDISELLQPNSALVNLVEVDVKNKIIILNASYEEQTGQLVNQIRQYLYSLKGCRAVGVGRTCQGLDSQPIVRGSKNCNRLQVH
jgi:hypothetical protein